MTEINYTEHQAANDKIAVKFNSAVDVTGKYAKLLSGEGFVCFKPCIEEVDKKGNYKLAVAFPEGTEFFNQIKEFVATVKKDFFGDKRGSFKMPLKSGKKYIADKVSSLTDEGADDEEIDDFKANYGHLSGSWFINLTTKFPLNDPTPNTKRKPTLLGPNMAPIDASEIEGTDIVRIKFVIFAWDGDDGRGVSMGLRACQLLKKGSWEGGDGGDSTDGFESVPLADGEEESTGGLEPVEEEAPAKKPAPKKKPAAKKPKPETEEVEEPEEVEEVDDYADEPPVKKAAPKKKATPKKEVAEEIEEAEYEDIEEETTAMSDDEVFDKE